MALENPGVGQVFAATVRAIEGRDASALDKLLALAEAVPEAQPGLISAFGWASPRALQGIASTQLAHDAEFRKRVGIAACALHRVDPGTALNAAIASPDAPLRARALRCTGEIGRLDLLPTCVLHMKDDADPNCAFWAAWSAALRGNRGQAVESLRHLSLAPDPLQARALQLALMILNVKEAHELLKLLARNPANRRVLIQGAGVAGNPSFIPWLVAQMSHDHVARLSGEAFSLITGIDLALLDLERKPPEKVEAGPNRDPQDSNVAMDADEGLPWPDAERVQRWWTDNTHRFPSGVRYFMGAPVSHDQCTEVLKSGYQRQRVIAAHYLCLLDPGTRLFNTSAPAWRQQRELAHMG